MNDKLYRSNSDKMLAGVCGGIAQKLNIDSTIVRLIWAFLIFFYGAGLFLYIISAIIIPLEPINNNDK